MAAVRHLHAGFPHVPTNGWPGSNSIEIEQEVQGLQRRVIATRRMIDQLQQAPRELPGQAQGGRGRLRARLGPVGVGAGGSPGPSV